MCTYDRHYFGVFLVERDTAYVYIFTFYILRILAFVSSSNDDIVVVYIEKYYFMLFNMFFLLVRQKSQITKILRCKVFAAAFSLHLQKPTKRQVL